MAAQYFTIAHRTSDNGVVMRKSVINAIAYFKRTSKLTISVNNVVDLLMGDLPVRLHDRVSYATVKRIMSEIARDTFIGYRYHAFFSYQLKNNDDDTFTLRMDAR